MGIKEAAAAALAGGVTPLRLVGDRIERFDTQKTVLRSYLLIESLDMGVLSPNEYRYVARRSKKGEALFVRLLEKICEEWDTFVTPGVECVSFSVPPRMLLDGRAGDILFSLLPKYPGVSASRLCAEISADIVYEDMELAKKRLAELQALGCRTAVFEVGDEYCPLFRLTGVPFTYAIADKFALAEMGEDGRVAGSLLHFFHSAGSLVLAPDLPDEASAAAARELGFDGCGMAFAPTEGGMTDAE